MPAPSDSGGGLIVLDRDDTRYAHPQGHVASGSSRGNGAAAVQMHNDPTKKSNGEERKFFLSIEEDGVIGALQKLNQLLRTAGHKKILCGKVPINWIGKEVAPGQIGLINHGGTPKLLTKPGRYPGFPLRLWWARSFKGVRGLSDTVITFQGLTIVQVSQNQVAVISDPQNRIFLLKNEGLVAYDTDGSYDVLAVVDQTHLPNTIKDHVTGAVLGRWLEVRMTSNTGLADSASKGYVVALFLDIPANNCAVLQSWNGLELRPAGQYCIIQPNVTLRGLYTLGENQFEMPTKDIFTRDQVPVSLTLYLKWQLEKPLELAKHGYKTPYDALRDKAQSILTQIVAHLDYSSMVQQRSIGGDAMKMPRSSDSSHFLDVLRTRAMKELRTAASEYGIKLKDLAVIDRQFKGEIASTMDKLTERALHAQVEAANVELENSNKVKQEEGVLSVARIKAKARNVESDAEAYAILTAARAVAERTGIEAKAVAERTRVEAEAQAHATRLAAEAEAEATRIKADADANIGNPFAQEMGRRRQEVARVAAFGDKAVFVPTEAMGIAVPAIAGLAAGMGAGLRN